MKIRSGFVSNSSSSSFIVISSNGDSSVLEEIRAKHGNCDEFVLDGSYGTYEFGWEWNTYSDFWSKLNFAYIQAKYCATGSGSVSPSETHPEWMEMLERVLKRSLNVKNIVWKIIVDQYNQYDQDVRGYIDHQSASHEGRNVDMFESEDALENFLFNKTSYIEGGNDNED